MSKADLLPEDLADTGKNRRVLDHGHLTEILAIRESRLYAIHKSDLQLGLLQTPPLYYG